MDYNYKTTRVRKNVLAWRMIFAIVLFSSVITLFSTGVQLYIEYRRDVSTITMSLDLIRDSHLEAISRSLWSFDMGILRAQLEGIQKIRDIQYLAVDDGEKLLLAVGQASSNPGIKRAMALEFHRGGQTLVLGTLHVEASMKGAYSRLLNRLTFILTTQAAKTFLVSTFIFLLFYRLVGQYLTKMAQFARALRLDTLNTEMNLGRPPVSNGLRTQDELDEVENAFNEMRVSLKLDIQKRHDAENALRASEESYRRLVQNIPGVVFRCNLKTGEMVFVSENILMVTGYSASEFQQGSVRLREQVIPEDRTMVNSAVITSRLQGKPYEVEYRVSDREGAIKVIQELGVVVADDQGHVEWVEAVLFEVTKKRETERKLQEFTRLMQTLIETTTDAIYIKDLQGRYLLVNDATLQAMGRERPEVIGKRDVEIFPAASAHAVEKADAAVMASGVAQTFEERLETTYGDSYWFSNKSPIFSEDGSPMGLVGISRNVTERKIAQKERETLEKRLRQAQKMEAVGTLAGGISHDFNNILSVILGYAELLQGDLVEQESSRHKVEQILKAGYRAKELVQQILAFSRMADEKKVPILPASGVKEGLKLLRSTIPSNIEISEDIDPKCKVITINPTQLHQVLMNLCTNAYHVLEKSGGRIEVSLHNRMLAETMLAGAHELAGEYVELRVRDNGPGIPEELLERIFEPYFTTKEVGKGTGMGLSIVHGIASKLGGAVTCASSPGKGAAFSVFFPVTPSGVVEDGDIEAPVQGGTEHILLIDDELPLLQMGQLTLEKLGYRVSSFINGQEALDAFLENPEQYDLVLTDQTMPELTGAHLARNILRIRPDIPVILCTGYSAVMSEQKAQEMGISAYVHKPLGKREIATLLRRLLDRRAAE